MSVQDLHRAGPLCVSLTNTGCPSETCTGRVHSVDAEMIFGGSTEERDAVIFARVSDTVRNRVVVLRCCLPALPGRLPPPRQSWPSGNEEIPKSVGQGSQLLVSYCEGKGGGGYFTDMMRCSPRRLWEFCYGPLLWCRWGPSIDR